MMATVGPVRSLTTGTGAALSGSGHTFTIASSAGSSYSIPVGTAVALDLAANMYLTSHTTYTQSHYDWGVYGTGGSEYAQFYQYLSVGTYTVSLGGWKGPAYDVVTVKLDGTIIGTYNGYSTGITTIYLPTFATVTVVASGAKAVWIGSNADFTISHLSFLRTA